MEHAHFFPAQRLPLLARPRVSRRALADDPALVVFLGPAGSGKSLAALDAARQLAGCGIDCVWVRVTEGASGFRGFWGHATAGLFASGLFGAGSRMARLVEGGVSTAATEHLIAAIGERSEPFAMVVDDFHLVSDVAVQTSLVALLERVGNLRVLLTSRARPDVLLGPETRATLLCRELGPAELAFSEEEVAALVAARLGAGRAESAERASAVFRETQGWPLATAAVLEERASSRVPHRRGGAFVESYVARMVRACPTEAARRALFASALIDECSPRVLASMLGSSMAVAEDTLHAFGSAVMSSWTDARGERWYRHHDLVREELARRASRELDARTVAGLHRAAAEALVPERPVEGIAAAVRSGDWGFLEALLIENPDYVYTRGERREAGKAFIRSVPEEARQRYPVIATLALLSEYAAPAGRFRRIADGFAVLAGPTLAKASLRPGPAGIGPAFLRMVAARLISRESLALRMADRIGASLEALDAVEARRLEPFLAATSTQRGITYIYAERFDDAEAALRRAERDDASNRGWHRAHALSLDALSNAVRGRIPAARELVSACEQVSIPFGWHDSYYGAGYRIAAALVHLESGDLAAAERHEAAMHEHRESIEHWPYLLLLSTLLAEQRHGAREALLRFDHEYERRHPRFGAIDTHRRMLEALRARLLWQSGGRAEGQGWHARTDVGALYRALSRRQYGRARALAAGFLSSTELVGFPRRRAEILLLHAHLALNDGDREAARTSAALAADLLGRNGLRLPYLALSRSALVRLAELEPGIDAARGAPDTPPAAPTLSRGEQRALAGVAEHGSVAAAAEALFLSEHTVRHQLKLAYRRLGVHTRSDAIRVAREAGLLQRRDP